jgi:hypothetical protein
MKRTLGTAALVLLGLMACDEAGSSDAARSETTPADRQTVIAERGAAVMPFDLDTSTHIFEKTRDGGVQQVVSDTGDPEQIALIRGHLREESGRFARGDFHDPAMIHGDDMAGLHDLMMGADRMTIEYTDVERGGQIRYASGDPDLVAAIHAWFDAQVSDHGDHARAHR